jgi:hypothetical protein
MEGISPFQSGRPLLSEITADKLNRILAEIKRNRPVVAAPLTSRVSGDGTYISIKQEPGGGGSSTPSTRQPWDLIARPDPESTSDNPPYLVRVQPGTLSEFLAVNWGEEFTIDATATRYAVAEVTTDGKAITQVEIKMESSPPASQQPTLFALASPIQILFGIVSQGAVFRTIGDGNIFVEPKIWFQEARTNAQPGESLFNLYYVLA